MKKMFLLMVLMLFWSLHQSPKAQCVVKNVIIKVNASSPSSAVPGSCTIDFDFIFTIENNGGNKYIYMHAWLANEYPNYFGCPTPPNNSKPPIAADLTLSRINLGIHNDVHSGHPAPTLISTYYPDPLVAITSTGQLIRSVYPAGDSARFTIKNVVITVPKACTDVINMKADFWSSQSQLAQNAQCVYCNRDFTIDPRVNGLLNCMLPHTFNIAITSSAPGSISGDFEVYLDNPSDAANPGSIGTYGPEDNVMVYSSPYSTVVSNGVNLFTAVNIPYAPYNNLKPDADKNLWVVVSTNQYANKAINLLRNTCAPLLFSKINFDVMLSNRSIVLNWSTREEQSMSGYFIERKYIGESFREIGFVEAYSAIGNNAGNYSYDFTDKQLKENTVVQYRLKFAENDGSYSYSEIRSIRTGVSGLGVTVYPNPGRGVFKVAVPANAGSYDILITDNNGRTIYTQSNLRNQSDINSIHTPGVYFMKVRIRETGEVITQKLVVL
jgi:Secretion system C-terminal sorting domain